MRQAIALFLLAFVLVAAKTDKAAPVTNPNAEEDMLATDNEMMADDTMAEPVVKATTPAPAAPTGQAGGTAAAINVLSNPSMQKLLSGKPEEVQARLDTLGRVTKALANTVRAQEAASKAVADKKK